MALFPNYEDSAYRKWPSAFGKPISLPTGAFLPLAGATTAPATEQNKPSSATTTTKPPSAAELPAKIGSKADDVALLPMKQAVGHMSYRQIKTKNGQTRTVKNRFNASRSSYLRLSTRTDEHKNGITSFSELVHFDYALVRVEGNKSARRAFTHHCRELGIRVSEPLEVIGSAHWYCPDCGLQTENPKTLTCDSCGDIPWRKANGENPLTTFQIYGCSEWGILASVKSWPMVRWYRAGKFACSEKPLNEDPVCGAWRTVESDKQNVKTQFIASRPIDSANFVAPNKTIRVVIRPATTPEASVGMNARTGKKQPRSSAAKAENWTDLMQAVIKRASENPNHWAYRAFVACYFGTPDVKLPAEAGAKIVEMNARFKDRSFYRT